MQFVEVKKGEIRENMFTIYFITLLICEFFQIFGGFLTLELTILLQQRGYKVAHEYFSKIQDLQIQIRNSCGRIM